MISVGDLRVKIDHISLPQHEIELERLKLDSASLFLEIYPGDSLLNIDYFLRGRHPTLLHLPVHQRHGIYFARNLQRTGLNSLTMMTVTKNRRRVWTSIISLFRKSF
jgi:hypothetical protein